MDLRTVLTHYYDMKVVRTELLCAIRDNVTDTQEMARISELVKDAVSIVLSLMSSWKHLRVQLNPFIPILI